MLLNPLSSKLSITWGGALGLKSQARLRFLDVYSYGQLNAVYCDFEPLEYTMHS